MPDARYTVVRLLMKTFSKEGYSNILLDKALKESSLDKRDKKLCSAIYYGVLERKLTLDYVISSYCRQRITKLRPEILNILRIGIYQLKFMEGIPDSAAVNESVKLAKKMGLVRLSGLVNGILRSFIRDEKNIKYPADETERISIEYSVPKQLVLMLLDNYGDEGLAFIKDSIGSPPIIIRLNTVLYEMEEILETISVLSPKSTFLEDCYEVSISDVTESEGYRRGMFHVQDIASQLCCRALGPEPGEIVFDMCAAPGGKTFTLAEIMKGKGKVYSFDIHENRVNLIKKGAKRLGLNNVFACRGDADLFNEKLPLADKILCDVPCSGLGVIRRKPEIKYKNLKEFENLSQIQYKILENAARYLKPRGELVYSTCTVNPAENDAVAEKFLKNHPEFKGEKFLEEYGKPFGTYKAVIFPKYFGSDGFFIAKFVKTE